MNYFMKKVTDQTATLTLGEFSRLEFQASNLLNESAVFLLKNIKYKSINYSHF